MQRVPRWKGPQACTNIWWRIRGYLSRVTIWYHAVTPHFRLDRNHGVTSTLHTFNSSVPRLQCPRSRCITNLVSRWIAIVFFLSLDHTHYHPPAWVQLSGNDIYLPKLLNNTKYHTATRLHSPFHLGLARIPTIVEHNIWGHPFL